MSEDVIQRAVAEARAEVEQENQKNKAEDTSQSSGHVTYQGMHYRARPNPEAELKGDQAKILERTVKKIADEYGLVYFNDWKLILFYVLFDGHFLLTCYPIRGEDGAEIAAHI